MNGFDVPFEMLFLPECLAPSSAARDCTDKWISRRSSRAARLHILRTLRKTQYEVQETRQGYASAGEKEREHRMKEAGGSAHFSDWHL
jgi:hypothetical protein